MAKTATKKTARKAAPAIEQETEAPTKEVGTCLFSGEPTGSKNSRFLPGFDAKLKSVLLKIAKGEEKLSTIPPLAMKELRKAPLLGFQYVNDEAGKRIEKIDSDGNVIDVSATKTPKKAAKEAPSAVRPAKTSARKRSAQRAVQEEAEEVE